MLQEILTTENIIQGGAVLIALILCGIVYKLVLILYHLVTNHETHFIAAMKDNSDATKENTQVLQSLKDLIISLRK